MPKAARWVMKGRGGYKLEYKLGYEFGYWLGCTWGHSAGIVGGGIGEPREEYPAA